MFLALLFLIIVCIILNHVVTVLLESLTDYFITLPQSWYLEEKALCVILHQTHSIQNTGTYSTKPLPTHLTGLVSITKEQKSPISLNVQYYF